jgi:hypothetical protein
MALGIQNRTDGFAFEKYFMKYVEHHGFEVERNDKNDLTRADFMLQIPVDPKVRKSPFFLAMKHHRLDPSKLVTIDLPKINSYLKHGKNAFLLVYVDYRPHFETRGLYIISARRVKEISKTYLRSGTHMDNEKNKLIPRAYISVDEMWNVSRFANLDRIDEYLEQTAIKEEEKRLRRLEKRQKLSS